MQGRLLAGKKVAEYYQQSIRKTLAELTSHRGTALPRLAILRVGNDRSSGIYATSMVKVAQGIGMAAVIYPQAEDVAEGVLLQVIEQLNRDKSIHGILLMMPLPAHLPTEKIIAAISPEKDIDGLTDTNIANVLIGKPGYAPCTPMAVMAILDYYDISVSGKELVIVGRSNVVGKPLTQLCLRRNATITNCHSYTKNLAEIVRRADILISAVGKAHIITAPMIKPGAVVIDVGMNRLDGKTVGDVDYDRVVPLASAITPVPGGVGAVTTTMVVKSLLASYLSQ